MRTILLPRALGAFAIAAAVGCGSPEMGKERSVPEATDGFAPFATTLRIPIGNGLERVCHGTVVASQWVLTAAHCLEGASPGARGYLESFNRGFPLRAAQLHPNAVDVDNPEDLQWQRDALNAAFDLALLRLESPLAVQPPIVASEQQAQAALERSNGQVRFSRRDPLGVDQTASAYLTGEVDASTLVGPRHSGTLLRGYCVGVYPGNSGAGVVAADNDGYPQGLDSSAALLLGVVQDANPDDPTLPFGVVPLYKPATQQWLDRALTEPF